GRIGGGFLVVGEPLQAQEQVSARAVLAGVCVQHRPAAQRVRRRDLPDDQAVVPLGDQRPLESKLPDLAPEPGHPTGALPRAVVNLNSVAGLWSRPTELKET